MKDKKLNICILLPFPHDPNMPFMGITEIYNIYGKYFPRLGHKVTWIALSKGKTKEIKEDFFNDVKVYTIPRFCDSSSSFKRGFDELLSFLKKAKFVTKNFKTEDYDIIQARDGILALDGILGIYIKRRYKIPFVFHYSTPIIGWHKPHSMKFHRIMIERILDFLSVRVMHNADLVLTSSKWLGQYLIQRGIPKSKIMAIPSCADIDLFSPREDGRKIRERYNLENASVIIYVGTLHQLRQLEILLHAFSKVRGGKNNVKLLVVGEGNDRANLEELASKLKIQNNVIFTGQVSHYEVPSFIAAADICVSPVPPLAVYKISSPTKVFEYMAMGKAVIANEEILDQMETIEQSGGGILVPFKEEEFARAIIDLLKDPEKTKEMGRKGREWVIKNRNYEMLAREVEERYFELLDYP